MLKYISVLVLLFAVFYFTPESTDNAINRRAPVPLTQCKETTPLAVKCKSGNAFVFFNGPSTHTVDILNVLQMLQIKATFFIETQPYTDWTIVKQAVSYGHGVGINVIRKYTTDIMSAVNADKQIWLDNIGIVPKFVAYTNSSLLDDAVNQVLLANNYYPSEWSLDLHDFVNSEAQIKTILGTASNDLILVNEFVESNFTSNTLKWFYNNTKSSFNTLQSCFGTNTSYWSNCSIPLTASYVKPAATQGGKPPSNSPSATPDTTPSAANRLSWLF